MSTHSLICKKNNNNTYTYIYCHNDGYPSGVGEQLQKYYRDPQTVDKLIKLGDLSTLGIIPISLKANWNFAWNEHNYTYCTAYKDRGEDWNRIKPKTVKKIEDIDFYTDYLYIFDPQTEEWQCAEYSFDTLQPLKNYLGGRTYMESLDNNKLHSYTYKVYFYPDEDIITVKAASEEEAARTVSFDLPESGNIERIELIRSDETNSTDDNELFEEYNSQRKKDITNFYRKAAYLDENCELTEDNLDEYALNKTSCWENVGIDELKEILLNK